MEKLLKQQPVHCSFCFFHLILQMYVDSCDVAIRRKAETIQADTPALSLIAETVEDMVKRTCPRLAAQGMAHLTGNNPMSGTTTPTNTFPVPLPPCLIIDNIMTYSRWPWETSARYLRIPISYQFVAVPQGTGVYHWPESWTLLITRRHPSLRDGRQHQEPPDAHEPS